VDLELGADLARDLLLAAVTARFLEIREQLLDRAMIRLQQCDCVRKLLIGHAFSPICSG
jgi:hypothetical protein